MNIRASVTRESDKKRKIFLAESAFMENGHKFIYKRIKIRFEWIINHVIPDTMKSLVPCNGYVLEHEFQEGYNEEYIVMTSLHIERRLTDTCRDTRVNKECHRFMGIEYLMRRSRRYACQLYKRHIHSTISEDIGASGV